MKKYFYPILLLLLCPSLLFSQAIPNGNFEDWDIVDFSTPDFWNTSAIENLTNGGPVASTQVDGFANSAIRLETLMFDDEIFPGFFSNSNGDPLAGEGGMPYNVPATSISGYYRYHLPELDTAIMVIIFKKAGIITSYDLFKIKGTGEQSEFTAFNFPLTANTDVDTVIVAATCSNLVSEQGVEVGSWIEFDELMFTGEAEMPAITNGSFDEWTDQSWQLPLGWNTRGLGITRSDDHYSGSYSIQLVNVNRDGESIEPSSITTSNVGNGPPGGGLPYTSLIDTLCGYYKFIAPEGQFAAMSAVIYADGMNTGGVYYQLHPVSDFTYFEFPLNSFTVPDTLGVEISSAAWPFDNIQEGNTLRVDHLQLKSAPLSNREISMTALSLFPNPSRNEVTIVLPDEVVNKETLFIYDSGGKCLTSIRITQSPLKLDTAALPNGVYSYRLNSEKSIASGQFIVAK